MVKLTKRKGFNFFRSYYDVYNELESKDDKVAFIDALFDRQFLGIKPTNLTGMAKFAYISQTNSIDSQVKGYEDKTKTKLNPLDVEVLPPTIPPCYGVTTPPTVQVEVKEKEKVQDVYSETTFLERWKKARMHYDKQITNISKLTGYEKTNFNNIIRTYNASDIDKAIAGMFQQKTYKATRLRPTHFLELEHFEKYLTCFSTKEKLYDDKFKKPIDRI